ncbi:MAG: ABC transporter substrate-binding protein [Chloroflexota bacterium]
MFKQSGESTGLSRRRFIVTVGATVGMTGGLAMLQACGQAPAPAPGKPTESKPAESKPAESKPAAAATAPAAKPADTAPAAAKPAEASKPAAQAAPASQTPRGTFTFATDQTASTLDPAFIRREPTKALSLLMTETLVRYDDPQNPKFVPWLAKSWTTSQDGKTWTVKLQENVKFHDGTPFNAEAVKFTYDRLKDPKVAATEAVGRIQILDRVDVVDTNTVNFVTKQPYADFVLALTDPGTAIVSPTAAQKGAVADFGRAPVGTGPYKFAEWKGTEAAIAVPNGDYWGPQKALMERVTLRVIPEAGAMIAGLEAGEIDYVSSVAPAFYDRLKANNKLKVSTHTPSAAYIMGVLTVKKPFDDVRVRQALMYAVDRDTIIKTILKGLALPATSPLWPGNPYRVEQTPYNYDPAKAKQLLKDAGYGNGFKMAILFSNFAPQPDACQAYAEYYSQVGIEVDLQQREDAVWGQLVRAKDNVRDLFLQSKGGIGTDFNLNRLYSSQLIDEDNRGRWVDPRIEEMLPKGRETFNDAERAKIYAEIQKIVWENVPELFAWHPQTVIAQKPEVQGTVFMPWAITYLHGVNKSS